MRVFKQWPMYVLGRIIPAAIAFFGIALYTRALEPSAFGEYSLLLSTSFLTGTACFSWIRVAAIRMMSTVDETDEPDYAATIVILFALSSAVTAGVIVSILYFFPLLHIFPFTITPVTIALTVGTAIASGWFELNIALTQARIKLATYSLLQAARAIVVLGSSLLLLAWGHKVDALLGGFIIGNCVSLAAIAMWFCALRGRFCPVVSGRIYAFGWPSSVSSLGGLSGTFQQYSIGLFGGASALGIYSAVSNFASQTIGLLIGTAALAGQPLSFRARDFGQPEELNEQLRNNARLVFLVGAGATAGIIALAGPLSSFFGAQYRADAAPLMIIFAIATCVGGIRSSYFEQGFEIVLKTRPIAILTAFRVVMYIVLSLFLIRRFGAFGAAYATLISECALLASTIVWTRQHIAMPIPLWSFVKMTVAAALMVSCIELVPGKDHIVGIGAAVVVGALVYMLALGLFYLSRVRSLLRFAHVSPRAAVQ